MHPLLEPRRPFSFMLRRILLSGVPLSGVYIADLATESTDTAMVGRLGSDFVAAAGLGGGISYIFTAFCMAPRAVTETVRPRRHNMGFGWRWH
jgi:Na+-driven multidrug efflux pump